MSFDFSGIISAMRNKASKRGASRMASSLPPRRVQGGIPLAGGALEALRKKYSQKGLARRQAIARQYQGG